MGLVAVLQPARIPDSPREPAGGMEAMTQAKHEVGAKMRQIKSGHGFSEGLVFLIALGAVNTWLSKWFLAGNRAIFPEI